MANDSTCAPPCAPNTAGALPVGAAPFVPAPVPPTTISVNTCSDNITETADVSNALPLQVTFPIGTVLLTRPCAQEFDKQILCDPDGTRVVAVVSYSATGVPTPTIYTLAGALYAGDPQRLTDCMLAGEESDALEWCDNGVNVTQWVVKCGGEPTGDVFWTNAAGAVITVPPSGPTLRRGVCAISNLVKSGGEQISGPTRQLSSAFTGAQSVWSSSGYTTLQSVTVIGRGITDGLPALTVNQVRIAHSVSGTVYNLMDGETRTFSVIKDTDSNLDGFFTVEAFGNAYSTITYTYL